MVEEALGTKRIATIVSVFLILLGGGSVAILDGAGRFVIGAICLVGLLVCVSVLARTNRKGSR